MDINELNPIIIGFAEINPREIVKTKIVRLIPVVNAISPPLDAAKKNTQEKIINARKYRLRVIVKYLDSFKIPLGVSSMGFSRFTKD
jgi:hypothetical protein